MDGSTVLAAAAVGGVRLRQVPTMPYS
jgi:hypothetical protein